LKPLAEKLRPESLSDFYGQEHILAKGSALRSMMEGGHLHSMIFWGPPGTGKTSLARMIACCCKANFLSISAVMSGVKDIRSVIESAEIAKSKNLQTVVFVDEVHRFNKSQQDAFLPHIESGLIYFIGATTENPAFEINNALLSRVHVYVLKSLTSEALLGIYQKALDFKNESDFTDIVFSGEARELLIDNADGDGRRLLQNLDLVLSSHTSGQIDCSVVKQLLSQRTIRNFDKNGTIFYDQISALHKSVRGSDPDAALYWFARLLDAGCDPNFIARRVCRMATEDVGNADPRALSLSIDCWEVWKRLGSPEGELAIAQAIVYCACAAKSNAVYSGLAMARKEVELNGSMSVPVHLQQNPIRSGRNSELAYRYDHDERGFSAGQTYFPEGLIDRCFYNPTENGLEGQIREKLVRLRVGRYKKESKI
jgi:putative ATPase